MQPLNITMYQLSPKGSGTVRTVGKLPHGYQQGEEDKLRFKFEREPRECIVYVTACGDFIHAVLGLHGCMYRDMGYGDMI